MCDTNCLNPDHKHHEEQLITIDMTGKNKKKVEESKKPTKIEYQLSKTLEWIAKFGKVHGKRYLYDRFVWNGSGEKSWIGCKIHGYFEQTPEAHYNQGQGCRQCGIEKIKDRRRNKDLTGIFIEKAKKVHEDFYSYLKTIYVKAIEKVIITCPIHGDFLQTPNSHLCGYGCDGCGIIKRANKKRKTLEQFIEEANKVHKFFYDYKEFIYKGAKIKGVIICPIHGRFSQMPDIHTQGGGCKKCGTEQSKIKQSKTLEWFLEKAFEAHRDLYDYSLFIYKNYHTKGIIICKKHGEFLQSPACHLKGVGCPECGFHHSKGEKRIENYFIENIINYSKQKTYDDCKIIFLLPFDFYLPDYNLLIEFDGLQHYQSIPFWGGEKEFNHRKKADRIKTKYCKKNGINLLRIPYWEENNIRIIIEEKIKSLTK